MAISFCIPLSNMCNKTKKAVHIAITTVRDGSTITTLERKIPLVTIKSISMTNLRDDWMVCWLFFRELKTVAFLGLERECFGRGGSCLSLLFQNRVGFQSNHLDKFKH